MEEEKKKINWFKYILILLLIIYGGLYFINISGYYDSNMRRKVEFTEEKIKEFEKDIENGKEVDINNYLKYQTKDYSNRASRIGLKLSTTLEKCISKGIKNTVKFIAKYLI